MRAIFRASVLAVELPTQFRFVNVLSWVPIKGIDDGGNIGIVW